MDAPLTVTQINRLIQIKRNEINQLRQLLSHPPGAEQTLNSGDQNETRTERRPTGSSASEIPGRSTEGAKAADDESIHSTATNPLSDQKFDLLSLPPRAIQLILEELTVRDLILVRSVCRHLNQYVLQILASVKSLGSPILTPDYLKCLVPKLQNQSVAEEYAFDREDLSFEEESNEMARFLAHFCPNLEFVHKASLVLILEFTRVLEEKGMQLKIRRIILRSVRELLKPDLMTLLKKYEQIQICTNIFHLDAARGFSRMKSSDRELILPRIIKLNTDRYYFTREEKLESLRSFVNLRELSIMIPLQDVHLIAECCPQIEHLQIITQGGDYEALPHLQLFISTQVPKYASFGLSIYMINPLHHDDARKIVDLLVEAKAKNCSSGDSDQLSSTTYHLGERWSVWSFARHLIISCWPENAWDSLFELCPSATEVRIYQELNDVAAFLRHLNHVRALHITISVEQVDLIAKYCPHLKRLEIKHWRVYHTLNLDRLETFITTQVPKYVSFNLEIVQEMPDKDARRVANLIAQSGTTFRYSMRFESTGLRLGSRWHFAMLDFPSSCRHVTVYAWPLDDMDLFVRLIHPHKRVSISAMMNSRDSARILARLKAMGLRAVRKGPECVKRAFRAQQLQLTG